MYSVAVDPKPWVEDEPNAMMVTGWPAISLLATCGNDPIDFAPPFAGRQGTRLKMSEADLATCFIDRCVRFCGNSGIAALVVPQNWLFLGTFKKLRQHLLSTVQLRFVTRLGEHSFESPQAAGAFAALVSSIARLEGHTSSDAAAAARHVERILNLPGGPVTEVTKLVGVREIASADAERLFPSYLDAVERLVTYVDGWSSR